MRAYGSYSWYEQFAQTEERSCANTRTTKVATLAIADGQVELVADVFVFSSRPRLQLLKRPFTSELVSVDRRLPINSENISGVSANWNDVVDDLMSKASAEAKFQQLSTLCPMCPLRETCQLREVIGQEARQLSGLSN